jgi:hypothetical protein
LLRQKFQNFYCVSSAFFGHIVQCPCLFHHTKDRNKSRSLISLLDKNFLVESGIVHQVYSIIDKGHVW